MKLDGPASPFIVILTLAYVLLPSSHGSATHKMVKIKIKISSFFLALIYSFFDFFKEDI